MRKPYQPKHLERATACYFDARRAVRAVRTIIGFIGSGSDSVTCDASMLSDVRFWLWHEFLLMRRRVSRRGRRHSRPSIAQELIPNRADRVGGVVETLAVQCGYFAATVPAVQHG